jgi:GYF domain 2
MTIASGEAKRWFYVREGRRHGPVETAKLVDLVLAGEVPENALVWHSGLPEWLEAREVEDIRRELPPPVPTPRAPPPPDPAPKELAEGAEPTAAGETAAEGAGDQDAPPADADPEGSADGQKRRRKRKHRHRDAKRRPNWLWPLVVVLVGLMVFLWWLLRRMNEVPPGRIIQTGSLAAGPVSYRAELGREPRISSRVRSCPPRLTTTATLSPGFASPSA